MGGAEAAALSAFGRHWGSAEMIAQARLANENTPKLQTFDARGIRRDVVEFHPAYHALHGARASTPGCTPSTWSADGKPAGGAGRGRARGALLHGGAGRDRTSVPDHHDARVGRRRWRLEPDAARAG